MDPRHRLYQENNPKVWSLFSSYRFQTHCLWRDEPNWLRQGEDLIHPAELQQNPHRPLAEIIPAKTKKTKNPPSPPKKKQRGSSKIKATKNLRVGHVFWKEKERR